MGLDYDEEHRARIMELALEYFREVEEGTIFAECLKETQDFIQMGKIEK